MIRPLLLSASIAVSLSGCARIAESSLNPFNWFGNSTADAATTAPAEIRPLVPEGRRVQVVEGRQLMQNIATLRIDRAPGGAIVHSMGIAATQGYFNAQLVLASIENGVMTLDFRAEVPAGFQAVGSERSRQISAAYTLTTQELAGISTVRVQGAQNARSARR